MEHQQSPYFRKVFEHKSGDGTQRSALGESTIPRGGNWEIDAARVGASSHSQTMHAGFQPEQMIAAMPKGADGRPMKEVLGRRGTDLATGGWARVSCMPPCQRRCA